MEATRPLFSRHTVMLTAYQVAALTEEVQRQGVTFSEALRQALAVWLKHREPTPLPPPIKARRIA